MENEQILIGIARFFICEKLVFAQPLQIEEKVHFGQFSSIFFLYVENKKLSEIPKYQRS
ncbi:TPA: hypothetical protein ACGOWF_002085 [Streptococcus suis]